MKEILYCDNRGQLFTHNEMLEDFKEKYDGGDDTNPIPWSEYYTRMIFDI